MPSGWQRRTNFTTYTLLFFPRFTRHGDRENIYRDTRWSGIFKGTRRTAAAVTFHGTHCGVIPKMLTRWQQKINFSAHIHLSVIIKISTRWQQRTVFHYLRSCAILKFNLKRHQRKKIITTFPGVLFFKCTRDSTTFFPHDILYGIIPK